MIKQKPNVKESGDYLAEMALRVLGLAMFVYLGYRSLDWLMWTFKDEDQIFAYLGLFSTSIGAVIFAFNFKKSYYYDAKSKKWRTDASRQFTAKTMMIVCAMGELALAVGDMTMTADMKNGTEMLTVGSIKTLMWLTAGLAALVLTAVASIELSVRHPETDPEYDMSEFDADNNGVIDSDEKPVSKPIGYNSDAALIAELRAENTRLKNINPTPASTDKK